MTASKRLSGSLHNLWNKIHPHNKTPMTNVSNSCKSITDMDPC